MIEVYLSGTQILPTDSFNLADESIVIDSTVRSRRTARLNFRSRNNTTSPQAGQEVKVYAHGGALLFGGYIEDAPRSVDAISQRLHSVSCRDYSSICDLRSAGERTYLNAKLNDIVRDIVTDSLATDGVSLALVPAGGGPTIEKLEIDYSTVAEAISAACRTVNYEWEINGDKQMRLYQPTATASLGTLNNTTVGIIDGSVKGKESLNGYANKIVVILSRVLTDEQTESFGGSHPDQPTNGSRRDWTLAYPVNSVPTVRVNGTDKTVGLDGVDTGKDWYWQASSAVIRQDPAATALANTDTLEVLYIGERTQQVFAQDSAEIAVRGAVETRSGVYEKIIRSDAAIAAADAQQFADSLLAQLKQVPYEIEFEAKGAGFNPGEKWTLAFSGHLTGDYIVTRTQWFTVPGSYDAAANGPQERMRVYASRGVIVRDLYESWKEGLSGSGSVSVTGGAAGGGGYTPPPAAENISTVTASPFYQTDRWGIDFTVNFGASRANIARAVVYVRGPIGGNSVDREAYSFVPPISGSFTASIGGEWLRGGASTSFRVVVETYNSAGMPTASPIQSSTFAVLPLDTTSQASSITVTSYTTTANADGLEVFGFNLAWTQANVDTSHTEIFIESFDSALGDYREEQLYVQTGPGGGDNGFAITGKGQWIDATPTSARNYRLTFYTIDTTGKRKPTPPQVVVSVSPGAGSLKLNRADLATVGDALAVSGGKLLVSDSGITSAKIQALAVTTAKLAANAVDTSKLAALAVTANELATSAVTSTKIANAAVGSAAIANLAVGNAAIADGAITNAKIQDATIASAKIASLNADKINAGTITVGAGGMTFSGFGGITISTGAALTNINASGVVSPNLYASASGYQWSVIGGFSGAIDYTGGMAGYINAPSLRIGGTQALDGSRNATIGGLRFSGNFQCPISSFSALSVPLTYTRGLAVYDASNFFFGWIPIFF